LAAGGLASNMDLSDLAKAGTRVFALVSYGQVILVCLLAPLFTKPSTWRVLDGTIAVILSILALMLAVRGVH